MYPTDGYTSTNTLSVFFFLLVTGFSAEAPKLIGILTRGDGHTVDSVDLGPDGKSFSRFVCIQFEIVYSFTDIDIPLTWALLVSFHSKMVRGWQTSILVLQLDWTTLS